MNSVRAKFKVQSTTGYEDSAGEPSVAVHMSVVTNENEDQNGENKSFWKWTPTGTIDMHITNPAVVGYFQEGQFVYVDFTIAE